ncbi:transporter, putative [Heliorestis convoluta]|uniref:Transporter, putative n=1 Tax=Heliorestis convoluta TaxID=356322 RepID=A0A5Q2MX91_9FIRM|nr:transporter, putative [Heliorestis convoluta]
MIDYSLLRSVMKWGHHYFIWPDRTVEWAINAYRYIVAEGLAARASAMVTNGLPLSPHVTGFLVKRKAPQLLWVADYSDPFSNNPHFENRFYDGPLERLMLSKVDRVVIPTEKATPCYVDLGVPAERVVVIPQLFAQPKDGAAAVTSAAVAESAAGDSVVDDGSRHRYVVDSSKINLLYAGELYADIRNPTEFVHGLVEAAKQFPQLCFHYFGNAGAMMDYIEGAGYAVDDVPIRVNHFRPRDEVLAVMKEMDLLVNLSNLSSTQVPSKIIDYLHACKPVLNVGPVIYDRFLNAPYERSVIAQVLMDFVELRLGGVFDFDYGDLKALYDFEANAARYVQVIEGQL